ncbi:MAG: hypothetical protein ABSE73_28645 [Planctomycetota bacterium]
MLNDRSRNWRLRNYSQEIEHCRLVSQIPFRIQPRDTVRTGFRALHLQEVDILVNAPVKVCFKTVFCPPANPGQQVSLIGGWMYRDALPLMVLASQNAVWNMLLGSINAPAEVCQAQFAFVPLITRFHRRLPLRFFGLTGQ